MMVFYFAIAYFAFGGAVGLVHPQLLRPMFVELWRADFDKMGFIKKSFLVLVGFVLYCALWPVAWFNAGKSQKKSKAAIDAQLERLRPLVTLYTTMNAPVKYGGGDGSSFEQAVVILGANLISGPRATYSYIEKRFPGAGQWRQSLQEQNGKNYDVLEFTTVEGEHKTVYFDISGHLSKSKGAQSP